MPNKPDQIWWFLLPNALSLQGRTKRSRWRRPRADGEGVGRDFVPRNCPQFVTAGVLAVGDHVEPGFSASGGTRTAAPVP